MRADWFKSTFSGGEGACVEVAHRATTVLIRDSKYTGPATDQPIIEVPTSHWRRFLDDCLSGNPTTIPGILTLAIHPDGSATLATPEGTELAYTPAEWDAFVKGIADGQFDRS
ncbi:DUF397 domain-containing protein [Nocardia cyriacigeorgica]|uniref:DUF397 domain-containing protein n=1 Tax=Nocardia cyriacigeorgica TaxID=135487 RepID=A0A5R8NFW0_9NOCA|nr:DUF397 domain-containing protein [Nocardia cyriacigeorgica]TLF74433.1 DUF397 domain-containing protein [Nocardia cyriacigeorgica]